MHTGYLIALEGLDGAGTTSQLAPLVEALSAHGHPSVATAEPSDGPIGQSLRRALQKQWHADESTLALLFAADRLHHLSTLILPQLAQGRIVVTDRYLLSSYAYQCTALDAPWIHSLNAKARPADLNLYFRIDPEIAKHRRQTRQQQEEHFEAAQRQRQVHQAYEDLIRQPDIAPHVKTIDAAMPKDDVTQHLIQTVLQWLAAKKAGTGAAQ